jgi:hypothetical protein
MVDRYEQLIAKIYARKRPSPSVPPDDRPTRRESTPACEELAAVS